MQTTLTSKGQVTLPKALRDALHLKAGDKITVEATGDGAFVMRPRKGDVRTLKGMLKYKGRPKTLEEIDEAVMRAVSEANR